MSQYKDYEVHVDFSGSCILVIEAEDSETAHEKVEAMDIQDMKKMAEFFHIDAEVVAINRY